jgi:hypothetical protein
MVEIFKTNVEQEEHSVLLITQLSNNFPNLKINFDLEDCDKILRVEGMPIPIETIQEALNNEPFECCLII